MKGLFVVSLLVASALSRDVGPDTVEFSPNLCDAPTCEYFQNFERVRVFYWDNFTFFFFPPVYLDFPSTIAIIIAR